MVEPLIAKATNINIKNIYWRRSIIFLYITVIYHTIWKQNMNKKTPLHVAVENNIKEAVDLLLSKGAKINEVDINYQKITNIF